MNRKQQKRKRARRQAHTPTPDRPRKTLKRASYPKVKQGHIVPKTFQRNFAVDDYVAVHVPAREDCVRLHVKNAGTRSRFYRRNRPDGTEIDDIEAALDVLESVTGPILKEVADGAPLTIDRKGVLTQFIAMQMLRGPSFFEEHNATVNRFVPEVLTADHIKPRLLAETNGDMALARERVIELFQHRTQAVTSMLRISGKIASVLGSMRWQLLRFDKPVVAYSDQPVFIWPLGVEKFTVAPRRPRFGPVNALEIRVPLSSDLVLLMTWADQEDVRDPVPAATAHAADTNALVIAQADKQWMHQPGSEPPVATGVLRPLSRAFEHRYATDAAEASERRHAAMAFLARTDERRFIDDIQVLTVHRQAA